MANQKRNSGNGKRSGAAFVASLTLAAILLTAAVYFLYPYVQTLINGQPVPAQPGQTSQPGGAATDPSVQDVPDTILAGVSINGIDVSGMTKADAMAATAKVPDSLLAGVSISVTADGANQKLNAGDLSLSTDHEAVVAQAMAFGKTGSEAARKQAADLAKSSGQAFTIRIVARRTQVKAALLPLKQKVDKAPVDATYAFMPSGFFENGQAYSPDPRKLADAHASGKSLEHAALVLIDPAEKPSPLRYQYWRTDRYVPGYIPAESTVARFKYSPEAEGRELDIEALADQVMAQLESGTDSEITVASRPVKPAHTVASLKKETMLIASWTSSYRAHASRARNWNVSRMASFIHGAVIEPGQSWSVNKAAGPRNPETAKTVGWKKAAGIVNGGYVDEEGGGVCQLGSTTFNAVLRAGLTIVTSTHHTIPSDYIPLGLDATLSTPAPDLILKNDRTEPVYLVSYVNPKDQNVTVEVYGQQPVDPAYGPVIYDYTSDNKGSRYGTPSIRTYYNTKVAPDKTVLSETNPIYVYAQPRPGTQIQTYKHIYSLDGKELSDPIPFENHKYPTINGRTYVFGPDPATVTPKPTPTAAPTPTTTATAKPAESGEAKPTAAGSVTPSATEPENPAAGGNVKPGATAKPPQKPA